MGKYNVEPLRTKREIQEMKEALKERCGERDEFLFFLGINVGLRISDLIRLKVKDIYGKAYTDVVEKKTGKIRRIHLTAIAGDIAVYCDGKQADDFLFPHYKKNEHISTTQAYRRLVLAAEWIGRNDIATHTMRKTFGYHYYQRTKDISTLMEIFGHDSPVITKLYIGIRDDEIAETLKDFRL